MAEVKQQQGVKRSADHSTGDSSKRAKISDVKSEIPKTCDRCGEFPATDPHDVKYHKLVCFDQLAIGAKHWSALHCDQEVATGEVTPRHMGILQRWKLIKKWTKLASEEDPGSDMTFLRVRTGGEFEGMMLSNLTTPEPILHLQDGNCLTLSDEQDIEDAWCFFHSLPEDAVELLMSSSERERLDMPPLPWSQRDPLDYWYYDQVIDPIVLKALQGILPHESKEVSTTDIMEVCAGSGRLARKLRKLGYTKYTGFDGTPTLVGLAKIENDVELKLLNVVEEVDALPQCDILIASGSVLTIQVGLKREYAMHALKGFAKCVRPGGWLIATGVSFPFIDCDDLASVGFTRVIQTWVPGVEGAVSITNSQDREMFSGIHCYVVQKVEVNPAPTCACDDGAQHEIECAGPLLSCKCEDGAQHEIECAGPAR